MHICTCNSMIRYSYFYDYFFQLTNTVQFHSVPMILPALFNFATFIYRPSVYSSCIELAHYPVGNETVS